MFCLATIIAVDQLKPRLDIDEMVFNLFCRICWNTLRWSRPSGDAARLEGGGSYAAAHGFGHEEWLFNFNWEDDVGFKYGFLQPIHKQYRLYNNEDGTIILYSKPDDWYFVAKIDNCHVLTPDEKKYAYELHKRMGWLDEMKSHLKALNCDTQIFDRDKEDIFNIKFRKEDVVFFDPFILVPPDHHARKFPRYQTFPGTFDFKSQFAKPAKFLGYSARLKSTSTRSRRAIPSTEFDPLHDKIQNALITFLQSKYGHKSVSSEDNRVDVSLRTPQETIFFEVKSDNTAKMCIRKGIGQLLEYAHWDAQVKVDKLVIVGWNKPDPITVDYLKRIRHNWNLPVYYSSFDLSVSALSQFY